MSKERNEVLSPETSTPQSESQPIQGPIPSAAAQRPAISVNDTKAVVCYANFCRVTGTPEELILDFGLNSNPIGGAEVVEVTQRLVMNYYTAKRLLQALGMSVQRHEAAFGALETDVQKRLMAIAQRASR
jgi:hypothetical protein